MAHDSWVEGLPYLGKILQRARAMAPGGDELPRLAEPVRRFARSGGVRACFGFGLGAVVQLGHVDRWLSLETV